MDSDSSPLEEEAAPETAGAMLATLRNHPEWSERERDFHLGRIVERFPAEILMRAVLQRLGDLSGTDAESLLRLLEIHAGPERLEALADALDQQPDLAADRAWEALSLLDEHGLLDDHPALRQRWDELNETLDDEGSIDQLIEQIEGDPEGLWMALQGLNAIEPEIRPRIIESLAERPLGPGLAEFLRLLVYAADPLTRIAALKALEAASTTIPSVRDAWLDLSAYHHDAEVVSIAGRKLDLAMPRSSPNRDVATIRSPRIIESSITSINAEGMAVIVIHSITGVRRAIASFLCQIEKGVLEVAGNLYESSSAAELGFESFVEESDRETIRDVHPLALSLLAGTLLLNSEKAPPSLRFWIEATAGSDLRAQPFQAAFPDWDPSQARFDDMPERVEAILKACPDWVDSSPLTYEIAEEILLREGDAAPNAKRDAGAYRFLFEHRLKDELESYRRRLLWMAWFWRASGREELGRSALGLAWQLSDPQHIVPSHPFSNAMSTRSLALAQWNLRRGQDSRSDRRGSKAAEAEQRQPRLGLPRD